MNNKIKVLIVDDSALIRLLLTEILSKDDEIEVVGAAEDPLEARDKIKRSNPDVITLDVEMPKMDGITFLSNLMRLRPMPVVMISTLTEKGADITMKALELGAFDFVAKPSVDVKDNLNQYSEEIISKVKTAARSNIGASSQNHTNSVSPSKSAVNNRFDIIAIGASTGGTEAIKRVVTELPANLPPIVMAQHIPDVFSTSYAQRLDGLTDIKVIEVRESLELMPGHAYLAPGDDHLYIYKKGSKYFANIKKSEKVNRHRPSVDVLFDSVADVAGKRAIGAILTGMGADGARGLKKMKDTGAITIAQDEASSIVWGMPGAAVAMDAVTKVLPLDKIASAFMRFISK
ncbi:MAG: chemotaxis response regulator protein-glutamate methylesterase [Kangiellaceae bacterium]|jgi:two-component system chemotaxis response regulator CheB|nr:chemotaxis response regulator protein-glutamate methylesterase [Kangiellaceae bacterium]